MSSDDSAPGARTPDLPEAPEHEGPAPAPDVPDPRAAALHEVALAVLTHLNTVTARVYGAHSLDAALSGIKERLRAGATHTQCLLVIDFLATWRHQQWPGHKWLYLDTNTPWKADKFDRYYANAVAWDTEGRPTSRPAKSGTRSTTHRRRVDDTGVVPMGASDRPPVFVHPDLQEKAARLGSTVEWMQAQWAGKEYGHEA